MKPVRNLILAASVFALLPVVSQAKTTPANILTNYGDIALAGFTDSLKTAEALDSAIDVLIANPNDATLSAAKTAWLAAREPYQQTEVYRFGNALVDDWEGKVNAWPLDEGLIDYVDNAYGTESDENDLYIANVIANKSLTLGGSTIDASTINGALLTDQLHEAGEVEANVATGYHAIEFLLWGQDLNGTGAGAGARPATDFDTANCTGGSCERRAEYLKAVSSLLVSDLQTMVSAWSKDGDARKDLGNKGANGGLATILTGMGSLSYGELAGERMKLGLLLNDPEEEHDCFSDNTHNSHYYDALGIRNVYTGQYKRADGSVVEGASLSALVMEKDAALDTEMQAKLDATMTAMSALKERAESVEAYDQMIGEGNAEGNAVVQAAIDALVDQTKTIERVMALLDISGVELEGSDSLDSPNSVFQ